MAQARKILKRRKAVKSIYTVTKTMEMVATARFKRAFARCNAARKYIAGCAELVDDILARTDRTKVRHPLLRPRTEKAPRVVLALASNRGLCGGFNASVLKLATEHVEDLRDEGYVVYVHASGKKGIGQLRFRGMELAAEYTEFDGQGLQWQNVARLADGFMGDFFSGRLSVLEIVYARLIGAGAWRPIVEKLLPVQVAEPLGSAEEERSRRQADRWRMQDRVEFDYVPSREAMLERLLPMTVRLRLYQCFMDSAVSEQIARMAAMRSASENAEEMMKSLQVKYNRTRQGQITTELAEILGGRAALEA
jgi:F-type H+-transporting ATPase subunit gamma